MTNNFARVIKAMRAPHSTKVLTAVSAFDSHYPETDKPTWAAILDFIRRNNVGLFVFGGDNLDCAAISHHTKGKPKFRPQGKMRKDLDGFKRELLDKVEAVLPKSATKVWLTGNHEDWLEQMLEEQPELDGLLSITDYLGLESLGWIVKPQGGHYTHGHMKWIHGDVLGGANAVKKALDIYVENIQFGHFHTSASATKVLPHSENAKWQAYSTPCVGRLDSHYLKNRPTGWVNGFAITEFYGNGYFNNYLVNVFNGRFAFGGKVYGR